MPSWVDLVLEESANFRRRRMEEEMAQMVIESRQQQLEQEKAKTSMIANALQAAQPGWQRGGERVDIGGFSTGGAPMQPTAVGPSRVSSATAPNVQPYMPAPQQQETAQLILRQKMGLPPETPTEKRQHDLAVYKEKVKIEEPAQMRMEAQRERMATERQLGMEQRQVQRQQEQARGDLIAQLINGQRKIESLAAREKEKIRTNPMYITAPPEERQAALDDTDRQAVEQYNELLMDTATFAEARKVSDLKLPKQKEFKQKGLISQAQIQRYRALPPRARKQFEQAFEKEYGRKFPKIRLEE